MPAGDVQDPTKLRSKVLQDSPADIETTYQTWLQTLGVGTTIHSVGQSRVNNGQEIVLVIGYELP